MDHEEDAYMNFLQNRPSTIYILDSLETHIHRLLLRHELWKRKGNHKKTTATLADLIEDPLQLGHQS